MFLISKSQKLWPRTTIHPWRDIEHQPWQWFGLVTSYITCEIWWNRIRMLSSLHPLPFWPLPLAPWPHALYPTWYRLIDTPTWLCRILGWVGKTWPATHPSSSSWHATKSLGHPTNAGDLLENAEEPRSCGGCKKSGAWLNALPISALGLRMDNDVRTAIGLRLGIPLCCPHQCQHCRGEVDKQATDCLSFIKCAVCHFRHAAINSIVQRSLATAETPCNLEPTGLSRDDGNYSDGCCHYCSVEVWMPACLGCHLPWYICGFLGCQVNQRNEGLLQKGQRAIREQSTSPYPITPLYTNGYRYLWGLRP